MCGGAVKTIASVATLGLSDALLSSGSPVPKETTSDAPKSIDVSAETSGAREDEKRRRAAAAGLSSTILGGNSMTGTTGTKSLLGS